MIGRWRVTGLRWRYLCRRLRAAAREVATGVRFFFLGPSAQQTRNVLNAIYATPEAPVCTCRSVVPRFSEYAHDHEPNCAWLARRCRPCGGTGCCDACQGDGLAPSADGSRE